MNKHFQWRKSAIPTALATIFALSGCASQQMKSVNKEVMEAKKTAEQLPPPAKTPVIRIVDTPWLKGARVHIHQQKAAILERYLTLSSSERMTLQKISEAISSSTGVRVEVDPSVYLPFSGMGGTNGATGTTVGAMPNTGAMGMAGPAAAAMLRSPATATMSVDYSGKLEGMLDQVASGLGVYWKLSDDKQSVILFRTETRSFDIKALNWATENDSSISSASSSGSATGGSSTTSTSGAATSANIGGTGQISVSTKANVDVWGNLQSTARQIAGVGAQVAMDSSNGILIVTGTPPQLERVSTWVHKLNKSLSRQVAVDVTIYSVNISREDNVGFNPSILWKNAQRFGLNLSGAPTITPNSGITPFSLGASVVTPTGGAARPWDGSTAIFQALSTLGNTSLVISRSAITSNGQPATIQQALNTGYLASVSTMPSVTPGIAPMTTLTPNVVTTGFTLQTTPRITGDEITLGLNLSLAPPPVMNTASSNGSTITTPTTSPSATQSIVTLRPGQALMLTGVQQNSNQVNDNGVGDPSFKALGGGRDTAHATQMLVVVVTARLI